VGGPVAVAEEFDSPDFWSAIIGFLSVFAGCGHAVVGCVNSHRRKIAAGGRSVGTFRSAPAIR